MWVGAVDGALDVGGSTAMKPSLEAELACGGRRRRYTWKRLCCCDLWAMEDPTDAGSIVMDRKVGSMLTDQMWNRVFP